VTEPAALGVRGNALTWVVPRESTQPDLGTSIPWRKALSRWDCSLVVDRDHDDHADASRLGPRRRWRFSGLGPASHRLRDGSPIVTHGMVGPMSAATAASRRNPPLVQRC
jgi:hypothetical protein